MILKSSELKEVKGGSWMSVAGVIAGVISFLIGVVDGLFRPLACEK